MHFSHLSSLLQPTEEPPLATFFKSIYDKTLSLTGFWVRKKVSQILPFKPEPVLSKTENFSQSIQAIDEKPLKIEDDEPAPMVEEVKTPFDKYKTFEELYNNSFSWSEKLYFRYFGKQQKELLNSLFDTYKIESKKIYNVPNSYRAICKAIKNRPSHSNILSPENTRKETAEEKYQVRGSSSISYMQAQTCASKFFKFFGVNIDKEARDYVTKVQGFNILNSPQPR